MRWNDYNKYAPTTEGQYLLEFSFVEDEHQYKVCNWCNDMSKLEDTFEEGSEGFYEFNEELDQYVEVQCDHWAHIIFEDPSTRVIKPKEEVEKEVIGYVLTIEEFIEDVESCAITDRDGYGFFYDGEKELRDVDVFSARHIPDNAQYIIWYNK